VEDEPSAEEQATGRESRREVVAALRGLPKRQRDCVALRYYLELPVPEIAETLGLSVNSVKTHLQRGLRSMAAVLQEKHQTEGAR
jgi:RNA polymerase sigma factor (sigma-70 family)